VDHVLGYLKGGFTTWKNAGKETDTVNRITPEQFASEVKIGESKIIDVRKESEYEAEHIEEAFSRPLAYINDWMRDIDPKEHFYLRSEEHTSELQSRENLVCR